MSFKIAEVIPRRKLIVFFLGLIFVALPVVGGTQNKTMTSVGKNYPPQRIDSPVEQFKSSALGSKFASIPAEELFQEYCKATAPKHRQEISNVFLLRKEKVLPAVIDHLRRGSDKEKIKAVKLISQTIWRETLPVLIELFSNTSESETVRIGAVYAIGELNTRETVPLLLDQLNKTSSLQMQRAILLTLGKLKDPNSANVIELQRTSRDSLLRLYAEVALAEVGKLKDKPSTAIDLSGSDDWITRSEAIRALGIIGGDDALRRLEEISVTHPLEGVRHSAEQAIKKAKLVGMDQSEALEYIELKLKDTDKEIQIWAIDIAAKELGNKGLGILKEKAKEPGEVGEAAAFAYIVQDEARKAVKPEVLGGDK